MKHFSEALKRVMGDQVTQVEMAALSGLNQVKISRLLSGHIRADRDDLAAILTAFPDANDRFQIVLGHVKDEVPEEALKEFTLEKSARALKDAPSYDMSSLSRTGSQALRFLLKLKHDIPSIEDVIVDLAKALGWTGPKPVDYLSSSPHRPSGAGFAAGTANKIAADIHKKHKQS